MKATCKSCLDPDLDIAVTFEDNQTNLNLDRFLDIEGLLYKEALMIP